MNPKNPRAVSRFFALRAASNPEFAICNVSPATAV